MNNTDQTHPKMHPILQKRTSDKSKTIARKSSFSTLERANFSKSLSKASFNLKQRTNNNINSCLHFDNIDIIPLTNEELKITDKAYLFGLKLNNT